MAVTLTKVGKTPGQTQFGLDTFTEHYKCDATADVVLTDPDVPQKLSAHPDYPFMFVTDRYCSETSESASALDLVYMGSLTGDETPDLPPQQTSAEQGVQSASSSKGTDGYFATSPITIQFYTPTNTLNYISYSAPGSDAAVDPIDDLTIISIAIADENVAGSSISALVPIFFQPQILETHQSTEIVAGKYWQNVSRKIKSYIAFVTTITPGVYISLAASGSGYAVGNTLTITSGGETATMTIDTLGLGNSVGSFTVVTNTFTVAHNFLAASGGSGMNAQFNVIVIT